MIHHLLRNSFYYLPKNTYTFEVGYHQLNKYLFNNPFTNNGFNFAINVKQQHLNVFWETNSKYNKHNLVNIDYQLTHYHNNRVHTRLHIQDSENDVKEFFYVKPNSIDNDYAKIIYALEYNGEKMYQFDFETHYDSPYRIHKSAIFNKYALYDKFSKKYLR